MHTGNGYEEEKVDLAAAEEIPEHQLRNLRIGPDDAIARAEHRVVEGNGEWGSNHNLIWPMLDDNTDTWNSWKCDSPTSWVEIDFQQKAHTICMVGFRAAVSLQTRTIS